MLPCAFVLLTILTTFAAAFFPFCPADLTLDGGVCGIGLAKREEPKVNSHGVRSASLGQALTFELRQLTPSEISHTIRLQAVLARLTRKYQSRVDKRTQTLALHKRNTNTYSIVSSNTPTQANSVALDQDGTDFSYFAVVKFGSSQTPMYMLMDTGASSTWVMGNTCTTAACLNHNSFGAANSSTYQTTTTPFSIAYGSGAVNGTYAKDNINFGGMTLAMTFGNAGYTSNDFLSFPMDGIMGLSRAQADSSGTATFLDTVIASKMLKANIFGVSINRNSDGLRDGEINFGAPDTSRYSGALSYTALAVTTGEWVIAVDSMGINNQKTTFTSSKVAYIDTGTSFIFIPPADATLFYANVPGAVASSDGVSYSVPCSTTISVQFWFSGIAYSVSSKDWVGSSVGNQMCMSNIYSRQLIGVNAWLLGDVFLKNVYAVFDADQNRIGFGAKTSGTTVSTSSSSATGKPTFTMSLQVVITIPAASDAPTIVVPTTSTPHMATASSTSVSVVAVASTPPSTTSLGSTRATILSNIPTPVSSSTATVTSSSTRTTVVTTSSSTLSSAAFLNSHGNSSSSTATISTFVAPSSTTQAAAASSSQAAAANHDTHLIVVVLASIFALVF